MGKWVVHCFVRIRRYIGRRGQNILKISFSWCVLFVMGLRCEECPVDIRWRNGEQMAEDGDVLYISNMDNWSLDSHLPNGNHYHNSKDNRHPAYRLCLEDYRWKMPRIIVFLHRLIWSYCFRCSFTAQIRKMLLLTTSVRLYCRQKGRRTIICCASRYFQK